MIEMMITLIIGGIVIFICIKVFSDFNHYFTSTIKEQGEANHLLWFTSRLKDDFNTSDSVIGTSEQLVIYSPIHRTIYEFNPNSIVLSRDSSKFTDSLHLDVKGIKVEYLTRNLVQSVNFLLAYKKSSYDIFLFKDYPNKVKYRITKPQ